MKKQIEIEDVEDVKKPIPKPEINVNATMIKQRDEYYILLKRLQDEGIVNIGVLENKIAALNKSIK